MLCDNLRINNEFVSASEIPFELGKKNEMIINIMKYLNGDIYLSGNGARKYIDEPLFESHDIKLEFSEFIHPVYPQLWNDFIPNLSIIDLLFNCGFESYKYILG